MDISRVRHPVFIVQISHSAWLDNDFQIIFPGDTPCGMRGAAGAGGLRATIIGGWLSGHGCCASALSPLARAWAQKPHLQPHPTGTGPAIGMQQHQACGTSERITRGGANGDSLGFAFIIGKDHVGDNGASLGGCAPRMPARSRLRTGRSGAGVGLAALSALGTSYARMGALRAKALVAASAARIAGVLGQGAWQAVRAVQQAAQGLPPIRLGRVLP